MAPCLRKFVQQTHNSTFLSQHFQLIKFETVLHTTTNFITKSNKVIITDGPFVINTRLSTVCYYYSIIIKYTSLYCLTLCMYWMGAVPYMSDIITRQVNDILSVLIIIIIVAATAGAAAVEQLLFYSLFRKTIWPASRVDFELFRWCSCKQANTSYFIKCHVIADFILTYTYTHSDYRDINGWGKIVSQHDAKLWTK